MGRIVHVILVVLFVVTAVALVAGQEASDVWLNGEALMLEMLNPAALDEAVLEPFHPDCRIVMDSILTRHINGPSDAVTTGAPSCRDVEDWQGIRHYVREFVARNDTAARFMRPSGIGAPWMVRYAVRCRDACREGTVGFEIRFTYDGRRVTRVELQAR